jgi:two-component system CheB/CheR fusion protein
MLSGDETPEKSHSTRRQSILPAKCASPLVVAGVGASAGGLEALESFFDHAPVDSGVAYVVIQHLSPDFKSLMDELLSRHTRIKIKRVEDGMEVEGDCIYLIPPKKEMIISGGRLLLTDKDPEQQLSMPIDTFFRSLAQDCGPCGVGIILSGTGSDGSRGIVAIHEAGGLVIAQDADTAKFDGMPRSALETGVLDLVLSPQKMPEALARYVKRHSPGDAEEAAEQDAADGMQTIFKLLRDEYGIDFSNYKPATVERRVERRLLITQQPDFASYVRQLSEDRSELNLLYKDLLIGVTKFFRDPEAFGVLEREVLRPMVLRAKENDELRFWIAGCATGEEAYSLAILLHEATATLRYPVSVKIFATDVHRSSLETAGLGVYSADAVAQVSPGRLQRYFQQQGDRYHVATELRKMIVFAPHNVLRDAPFTRLHMVMCRNLLIYFQPAAQRKVIGLFHFGVKAGGIVVLGPSETPGELNDEFEPINAHWRVYRKRRDVRLPPDLRVPHAAGVPLARLPIGGRPNQQAIANPQLMRVYDTLLDEFMPAGFILNERREVLHSFGGASRFMRFRDGRPTADVLELVENDLKLALAGALHRASTSAEPVKYTGVRVKLESGEQEIDLTVRRIAGREGEERHMLVLLETATRPQILTSPSETYEAGQVSREQLSSLEAELQYTRENLQATLEEMETSNEELQATNEELIASNEELQSTNEELHSVNEELYTVNAEYQRKIIELTEMTDDLNNLFENLEEGVAFLDREMCIRKFTPQMARVFQLMPQDIGRRIDTFAHNIAYDGLIDDIRKALVDHKNVEREVTDRNGKDYLLRIAPYRTRVRVDGVVLKLLDVSTLKASEDQVRLLSKVFMDGADAIVIEKLDGTILDVNTEAERAYGWTRDELVGHNVAMLQPESMRAQAAELRKQCLSSEQVRGVETLRLSKDGQTQPVLKSLSLLTDDSGKPIAIASIAKNIASLKAAQDESSRFATELKEANTELTESVEKLQLAEEAAREAVRRRDQFLAILSHELRNPLSAILTATHLLARGDADPNSQQQAGSIIRRQSEQMARLLDDLLDVARVTENKIKLERQQVNLAELAPEVAQSVNSVMDSRGHKFQVDIAEDPLWIEADHTRLLQIQTNLLTNAAKYTPPGGDICLRIERDGDTAVIRVRDSGMGIAKPMLERVFDLFVQADDTLHRSDGGLGVGLTLVKSLVAMHGGSVSAQSEGLGRGAEFVVRLPLVANDKIAAPVEPKETKIKPMKILVVEDNHDSREMLCHLLRLDGHQIKSAPDGLQGLSLLENDHFDVALVDVGLPGLDGFEVARRTRRKRTDGHPLLVALTGYGREEDRRAVIEAGFDVHVVKPFKLAELHSALAKAGQTI